MDEIMSSENARSEDESNRFFVLLLIRKTCGNIFCESIVFYFLSVICYETIFIHISRLV